MEDSLAILEVGKLIALGMFCYYTVGYILGFEK